MYLDFIHLKSYGDVTHRPHVPWYSRLEPKQNKLIKLIIIIYFYTKMLKLDFDLQAVWPSRVATRGQCDIICFVLLLLSVFEFQKSVV